MSKIDQNYIYKIKRNSDVYSDLTVIILGSIYAYRMKTSGAKPLYHIENQKRTIDHIIEDINEVFPKSEKIITIGFEAQKVINYLKDVRFIENQLYNTTNTAEEVRLALNATLNEKILIINSDIVFEKSILNGLNLNKSFVFSQENDDNNIISVNVVDGKITYFTYNNPIKWCNMIYLTGRELNMVKKIGSKYPYSTYYFFEILNEVIDRGGVLNNIDTTGTSFKKFYSIAKLNENSDI